MSQALDFTCGPAALIRFLNWRGSSIANNLGNQIRIWRTANTVYMGQGPAGCDAAGLVKAAEEFGESANLLRTKPDFSFASTVRDHERRAVIRLAEREHLAFANGLGRVCVCKDMREALAIVGHRPMLLLCSMRAYSMSNVHHWIACRPRGKGSELYDPSTGQYEAALDQAFFKNITEKGIETALQAYSKYFIDIIY
ncbi:MAG TPA: peptidase C39 family protein [Rhizobiaceae bacterium]|nr:peptidase C39 family protein [Rhizobiaceae bacterium]